MILALELCEEIVVYGMVSDSYCRSGQSGPGQEGSWEAGRTVGLMLEDLEAVGAGRVGFQMGGRSTDISRAQPLG